MLIIKILKKLSLSTPFLFLVSLVVAISIAVGVKTIDTIHSMHMDQQPLANATITLESNFSNFNLEKFGIYPRTFRVVSDSRMSNLGTQIFTSSRDTQIIREYLYTPDAQTSHLVKRAVYDLSRIPFLGKGGISSKYWVFDLQIDGDFLYISLVVQPQKYNSCDEYRIVAIPLVKDKLQIKQADSVWKFNQCISSFPNFPGWHDFQGRLSVSTNYVYMTAGLLVASTYQGFYPNPFLSNLLPTLEEEMTRDNLFGGLLQVNKRDRKAKLFARGFRGPSGIAITGSGMSETIWVADHGPRGGDELNKVDFDHDYGWPWVSYGTKYFDAIPGQSGYIDTQFGSHVGYSKPTYYWVPSIAPSQLVSLERSSFNIPTWDRNDLIMGSLKAESLFHINLSESNNVESIEQIFIGHRIRDMSVKNDHIFMTTDDGQIIILSPNDTKLSSGAFPPIEAISESPASMDLLEKISYWINRIGLSIQYRGTQIYRKYFSD